MRVLIIDDEDDIREVAQASLELMGDWVVITASSGAEGVRTAAAERPDVILLDVMMPGMDGPATLAALRADEATAAIPVVLLTAKAQSSDRSALDRLGAAGVIAKPFDPLGLSDELTAVLARRDDAG
jgi:two-component system, OmpR family, alkaline phosphatase synthesis response regulator PhoP